MRTAIGLSILALCLAGAGPEPDLAPLVNGLRSDSREIRLATLRKIQALESIPDRLIAPLTAFIRLDFAQSLLPGKMAASGKSRPVAEVPLTGEEVSITRIKANPDDYTKDDFIICGGVSISDYYNYGFSSAVKTHYSFSFVQVDKKAEPNPSSRAHLYLNRELGRAFAEAITRRQEANPGNDYFLARLRCTVDEDRIRGREENVADNIEILDWQFISPDKDEWEPWNFASVVDGFSLLRRAGKPAVSVLTEFVVSENEFQNHSADFLLRLLATHVLARLDVESKLEADAIMENAWKRSKNPLVKEWALAAHKALDVEAEKKLAKKKKSVAPASRSTSLLSSAGALEKAGKTAAALRIYEQLVKDFPDTDAAKKAVERIKAIGGKQ